MNRRALLALPFVALAGIALAWQTVTPTATLALASAKAKPNSEIKGTVTIKFPDGWHGYQNPPSKDYQIPVKVESADSAIKMVKAAYPKGTMEQVAGEQAAVYKDSVRIPVTLKLGAKTGVQTVKVKVSYQLCDDSSCQPPNSITINAKVTVAK